MNKSSNPKDIVSAGKIPLHLWPTTATAMGCLGLLDGAGKYGRSNFRAIGVKASVYVDACKRHLDAWFEGEEADPDSGLPHLAHALACLAIIVDAKAADKLNDDRMVAGGYRKLINELTPHVARLKTLHADKSPKHYTIADAELAEEQQGAEVAGLKHGPVTLRNPCNVPHNPGAHCLSAVPLFYRQKDPGCGGCDMLGEHQLFACNSRCTGNIPASCVRSVASRQSELGCEGCILRNGNLIPTAHTVDKS